MSALPGYDAWLEQPYQERAADGEAFADWLDDHPELTPSYLDDLRAGECAENLRDFLLDELQSAGVIERIAVAVAQGNASKVFTLMTAALFAAQVNAAEYDELKAREKYDALLSRY